MQYRENISHYYIVQCINKPECLNVYIFKAKYDEAMFININSGLGEGGRTDICNVFAMTKIKFNAKDVPHLAMSEPVSHRTG